MVTILDELRARGWRDEDFNFNAGKAACRVGYSFLQNASVFEPMPWARRWLKPALRPTVESVLAGRKLRIDLEAYDDPGSHHLTARWIDNQERFPFGEWMAPARFGRISVRVFCTSQKAPCFFDISYGAFSAGRAVELEAF